MHNRLAVFDRHYTVAIERPLDSKVGGAISVGAGEGGGQAITRGAICNWMRSCGAIGVPDPAVASRMTIHVAGERNEQVNTV